MENIHSPPERWRLITIDWIDAVGKTTLAKGLSERLSGIYYKTPWKKTKEERNHFDRPNISVQERFNFYSRALKEDAMEISELLKTWKHIICDRFVVSTIIHHKAMDKNVDVGEIEKTGHLPWLIQILLVATKESILDRLLRREELTRFEKDEDLMIKSQWLYIKRAFDLVIDTTRFSIEETLSRTLLLINNPTNYEKLL
ncbi:MAG: hypothetical protein ACD_71C00097G0008 [uncultured bacterium (gcode 4)]|uniref:Thymidylate kinase-like domain-containing protein n=1 Tax=uncultured bacterium (gcode 4) TaxID=1234023 RepID=K1Z4Y7_9BACT|nr:MAG: hypothetical protein ACD_71C00097G0008 [uncultured bacterium (gcode 4)]